MAGRKKPHFLRGQLAMLADGKVADPHATDLDAHQLKDLAANGLDHAPNLPVAPFANGDFKKRGSRGIANARDNGRLGGTVTQRDAAA